jgi:hypothetical protein
LGAIIAADAGVLAAWRPVALDLVAQCGENAKIGASIPNISHKRFSMLAP